MLSFLFGSRPAGAFSPVEGNTAFALDLYDQLKSASGNIFFSPFSISAALAITYAGARGNTEKQMRQVLHFGEQQKQVHASFGELLRKVRDAGERWGIELSIANALWAQRGYAFRSAFLEIAQGEYDAKVAEADFDEAEAARSEINHWVSQQTRERILNIVPPGGFSTTPPTLLVLVNAIYFKGSWAKPYDKSETAGRPFYLSSTRHSEAPFMHHFDDVRYVENPEFQAVELPYMGGGLSMMIFLPRKIDGCGELERRLNPGLLARSLSAMKPQRVEIYLPRFKLEFDLDLSTTLKKMGMPDAFEWNRADFFGMARTRNLLLSGVFHKAWGEVNEKGTEAAAATIVKMVGCCSHEPPPPPPPVFRADHPFVFLIRDTASGSLLFLGRLANPAN